MTDFGGFFGVCKSCVPRVYSVCTFLTLGFVASPALAGAWEEFEARCLVPMEDFSEISAIGLHGTKEGRSKWVDDHSADLGRMYVPEADEFAIIIVEADIGSVEQCWVIGPENDADRTLRNDWIASQLGEGRYVETTDRLTIHQEFQSNLWREPVLLVGIIDGEGPEPAMYFVSETDLES